VPRLGSQAEVLDRAGTRIPLAPSEDGNHWVLTLEPATRRFDHPMLGSDPVGYFYIGGPPLIILEEGVPPDAPVLPPVRLP
jgi:hypothetical protein